LKTIIWDIDDVLNNITKIWFTDCWIPAHPDCRLNFEDLTENPPHRLLGIKREEYLASLDRFRLSPDVLKMIPDIHLINWFKRNGVKFRHIALTARSRKTVHSAFAWVLLYFGQWFQTFSFVPAERIGEPPGHPDREKVEFLSWLGKGDFIIDDNAGNIAEAKKLGIEAFLVDRPWNQDGRSLVNILEYLPGTIVD